MHKDMKTECIPSSESNLPKRTHHDFPKEGISVEKSCTHSAAQCSGQRPSLTISPSICLVDEKISISLSGLRASQIVTLTCYVEEGSAMFESRGVYRADKDGKIENQRDASLAGTFTKVDQMGLFWSLQALPGQRPGARLIKKDVMTSLDCLIKVYDGIHVGVEKIQEMPLASATVHRYYKSPSVRRIPVTEGKFRGTIFIPPGEGPFASLVDMYGGLVTLVESRAALLASHGYATFAYSYLYLTEQQQLTGFTEPSNIKEAAEWFCQQPFVDETRLGLIGLCYGGYLSLLCAAMCPKVKAVVNINGNSLVPTTSEEDLVAGTLGEFTAHGAPWPNPEKGYLTKEGIVIFPSFEGHNLNAIPAWIHGARVLSIVGEEDKQTHPLSHRQFANQWPARFKSNIRLVAYPGAGHLIEPPYSPLCSVINPGKKRMSLITFVKEEFRGELVLAGGQPESHARAQEESWHEILTFLHQHLQQGTKDQPVAKGNL